MFCVECGSEISVAAKFCSKCGTKITQVESDIENSTIRSPRFSLELSLEQRQTQLDSIDALVLALAAFHNEAKKYLFDHLTYICHPTEHNAVLAYIPADDGDGSFEGTDVGCVADLALASNNKNSWFRCLPAEMKEDVLSGKDYYITDYLAKGYVKILPQNLEAAMQYLNAPIMFALFHSETWRPTRLGQLEFVTINEFIDSN